MLPTLGRTQITDEGLSQLKPLKNLERLILSGSQTTEEGRSKIRYMLPTCFIEG